MRPGEAVSLQRTKAWWAYSEIRSLRLTEEYRIDPRVPPLSAKIETLCVTSFGFSSVCFGTVSVCVDDAAAQWMTRQLNSRPVHRPVGLAGYRYGTAALSLVVCDDPRHRERTGSGWPGAKELLHTGKAGRASAIRATGQAVVSLCWRVSLVRND